MAVSAVESPAELALCASCFEDTHGHDPDMGDADWLIWEPGTCGSCGREMIVFRVAF